MFQTAHQICKRVMLILIKGYRFMISPFLLSRCRFYPSCSVYSQFVFEHYSFIKAIRLTFGRLFKCHPWHPGGFDYPPGFPREDLHKDLHKDNK
jgi:uncharacterized protein